MNDIKLVNTMITIAATHKPAMIGVLRFLVDFYIKYTLLCLCILNYIFYMSQSVTWRNIS